MDSFAILQRNFRHLYSDAFWFGVLSGSTVAFISIYAARLGANGFQIGLLTAGPAVVNLVVSLPAGRWLENRPLIGASFWSAVWSRIGYLLLIFLPWLFNPQGQIQTLIWVTLYISFPATVLVIGFNALFAEVVPTRLRAEVVGRRNALLAVSMTVSTLLCGLILDQIVFPLNYQVVFSLGALGAGFSTYHMSRLKPLPSGLRTVVQNHGAAQTAWEQIRSAVRKLEKLPFRGGTALRSLLHLDLLRGKLGFFMTSYLLVYLFQYLGIPLFPLAYVNSLHLSDGMISLGSGIFYGAMFLVSLRLKILAARFGHHHLLAVSALGLFAYPFLVGIAKGPGMFLLASLVGGINYGVLNASMLNRLLEVIPEKDRAAGMAFHNLALNLGILVGSLVGPILGNWVGYQEGLLLCAGLRLLAGVLVIFWG